MYKIVLVSKCRDIKIVLVSKCKDIRDICSAYKVSECLVCLYGQSVVRREWLVLACFEVKTHF